MKKEATISKSVVPFILTNPVGVDVVVKALQTQLLADLPWLEKSFNRAAIMSRKDKEGDNFEFPICFVADGKDEINMIGQDNWAGYSFFVARETETPVDFNNLDDNEWERKLSLYVYINLEKANAIEAFEYPEVLKQQIILSVRNTFFPSNETLVSIDIEDDPLVIFDGFTVDPARTQFLYHPFKGYRFDFTATYTDTIICEEPIIIDPPTNLVLSNITEDSITLNWD